MSEYIKIGEVAPDFVLSNKDGNEIKLSDYKGKKVVLYFYPKDDTPGCTTEACDFRDHVKNFSDKNVVILGVSKDSGMSHMNFATKYELPYELLSDTEGVVCELYGIWQLKKNYGREYMGIVRTTYVIDEKGLVEKVYQVSRVSGHVEQVLEEI
jgi:peroxiredoxin Q/BCP